MIFVLVGGGVVFGKCGFSLVFCFFSFFPFFLSVDFCVILLLSLEHCFSFSWDHSRKWSRYRSHVWIHTVSHTWRCLQNLARRRKPRWIDGSAGINVPKSKITSDTFHGAREDWDGKTPTYWNFLPADGPDWTRSHTGRITRIQEEPAKLEISRVRSCSQQAWRQVRNEREQGVVLWCHAHRKN